MKFLGGSEKTIDDSFPERDEAAIHGAPLEDLHKSRWERSWPTIACGAGLFSDGYLNGSEPHTCSLRGSCSLLMSGNLGSSVK